MINGEMTRTTRMEAEVKSQQTTTQTETPKMEAEVETPKITTRYTLAGKAKFSQFMGLHTRMVCVKLLRNNATSTAPNVRTIIIMVGIATTVTGGMTGTVIPGLPTITTEITTGVDTGVTTNKIIMLIAAADRNHADATGIGAPNAVQEALATIIEETTTLTLQSV